MSEGRSDVRTLHSYKQLEEVLGVMTLCREVELSARWRSVWSNPLITNHSSNPFRAYASYETFLKESLNCHRYVAWTERGNLVDCIAQAHITTKHVGINLKLKYVFLLNLHEIKLLQPTFSSNLCWRKPEPCLQVELTLRHFLLLRTASRLTLIYNDLVHFWLPRLTRPR